MAKNSAISMLPVLSLVLLLSSRASEGSDEYVDRGLLSSFRASIDDPLRSLSNWVNSSASPYSSTGFCKWSGVTCDNSSSHVAKIELSGKNISGKIEASIFQMGYIQEIDLSDNKLSGEIPRNVFSCSSLRRLNLSNNNLTGPIPSGSIAHLETLDLSNNMLSGKIPEDIGLFFSLEFLDLGGNVLTGRIPSGISNISFLGVLTLASNQLVGEIPRELGQLKSLKWMYLGYNNLSGQIPSEIGDLSSLKHLDLVTNNLTGPIPPSLGNLSVLEYLFLYRNELTGPIPRPIFGLQKLISLDLSQNSLSGEIPELISHMQSLEILHLFSNNFTGKIPNALSSLPKLQVLQLWSNGLSGPIPEGLGKQNNLSVLDLSTNYLTGMIPESLCGSGSLFKLILFSNSLEGEIPMSLSSCKSLRRVRLQNNRLNGELPTGFTRLPLVYYLDVSSNKLSGKIGEQRWDMPSLQMLNLARNGFSGNLPEGFGSENLENLDLSENGFSGTIPRSYGTISELMQLKLNDNKLLGNIPAQLSSCKKLVTLDLSSNQLGGPIPASISDMLVLGNLDLSDNKLSGEIPSNLGNVQSLVQVNISHNRLHGSLPPTGAFLAINASAVAGNDLCSKDVATGLPPCKGAKGSARWFLVVCSLAALMATALSAFAFLAIRQRRRFVPKRVESQDGAWEMHCFDPDLPRSITLDDVLNSAKEENIISRGKAGISYQGRSITKDIKFFMKEVNDIDMFDSPSLKSEVLELGKLKHPNIVKLMGLCVSHKNGFFIFEHVDGKSLSEALRGLSWERRGKIAIGVAKALRFLHRDRSPRFVVSDLRPEKIMVDEKDEPRLRLSYPGVLCTDKYKCFISSVYVAPEAGETKEITEKSDIYAFGLLLVEMLTGKSPADAELGVHDSIVDWARYCYSDCHLDAWADPAIRGTASHGPNEMVEAMNLALHCTASDPSARPCASDVYRTLASVLRGSSCVSALKFSSLA
ncbi:leucine-rich repeat receptor-like serine/threonine-protein kinase SKM1 [Rhodamnia argentea]|uniref:non-specific serine/threonine protein kinase n=1 Tax=Rhodamnia argentea TaxID=178133 RepID=A0A8B8Q9A0_9MYRT|nr:leucine-rich repeat receptor-like serine/threonine-protein kinase SKM1 [Rhodamnia argentea]XP_030543094.1 leucine-rich repeat receptor-like serine/threonine-protein kinase SKM1 [Rhodamnia argentea]